MGGRSMRVDPLSVLSRSDRSGSFGRKRRSNRAHASFGGTYEIRRSEAREIYDDEQARATPRCKWGWVKSGTWPPGPSS